MSRTFACYTKSVDLGAVRLLIDVRGRTANDTLKEISRHSLRREGFIIRLANGNLGPTMDYLKNVQAFARSGT